MVLILRTIEGSANAPFEEKLDPYKSALLISRDAIEKKYFWIFWI